LKPVPGLPLLSRPVKTIQAMKKIFFGYTSPVYLIFLLKNWKKSLNILSAKQTIINKLKSLQHSISKKKSFGSFNIKINLANRYIFSRGSHLNFLYFYSAFTP
jgi:hypothetical protein